jgi:hypothetical protein
MRQPSPSGSQQAQRVYDALFPNHVEVCAVTQYRRKRFKPGGWGGHATMFVTGAEIERDARYPRLRLVPEGNDVSGSGAGISVNQIFRSVNWVAIPGRDEFFRGGLAPDRTLDEACYEAAVRRASEAGWFADIRVKDALMKQKPMAMPTQEFIVRNSIGTDFALNFARHGYCARLPMSRERLGKVIAFLNGVNERAQLASYTWDAYTNNCSHVLHNALAAAGVWDPKEARDPGALNMVRNILSVAKAMAFERLADFSFPANNFVRVYEAGNERPIDDVLAAFDDHDVPRTMHEGWTSTGPGAFIITAPMHDESRNELFDAGVDPFLVSVPLVWDKREKFEMLTRHPPSSLTDLGANLAHWRERYARALERQRPLEDELTLVGDEDKQRFRQFYGRFYEHTASELRRTDARIVDYRRMVGPG